jgi:hypothetical protein
MRLEGRREDMQLCGPDDYLAKDRRRTATSARPCSGARLRNGWPHPSGRATPGRLPAWLSSPARQSCCDDDRALRDDRGGAGSVTHCLDRSAATRWDRCQAAPSAWPGCLLAADPT